MHNQMSQILSQMKKPPAAPYDSATSHEAMAVAEAAVAWVDFKITPGGSISLQKAIFGQAQAEEDPLALHSAILKGGTSIREVKSLAQRLGISEEELSRRCGLSRATFHRRVKANANLAPMEADVWTRYALLFKQAVEVFEDEESARNWLRTAQPALGDQLPLDLAQSTTGFREVEKLLTRLDRGVYV